MEGKSLMRVSSVLLLALGAIFLCTGETCAQKKKKLPKWQIDKYTKNKPKEMAKFGYVSYGPFSFGQRGAATTTSEVISKHMHYTQIRWVETAHYRIGLELPSYTVPFNPKIKAKIRAELTRLKERTGNSLIKPKTRTIDPWLRLHLIAQRLEEHYALMQDWLGVTDKSFPQNAEEYKSWSPKLYMGEGGYMGQKGKYLVLVFQDNSAYKDYILSFIGRKTEQGQQWNFKHKSIDALMYAVAADNNSEGGRLKDDTALHCHLVHAMTHLIINGYRHYNYNLPVWIREGLAHYFERLIDPKWNSYTRSEGAAPIKNKSWKWKPLTRKFISSKKATPFSEAFKWSDFGKMEIEDHVTIWSRWDYLMGKGQKKFAAFMIEIKGGSDPTIWASSGENVVENTRKALQKVYRLTPLSLDEKWKAWVKETYPTK